MKERPILFSAPMVRALLAGTKTQTRRAVKPQPRRVDGGVPYGDGPAWAHAEPGTAMIPCVYGKRGDRLWVREAHAFSVVDPEGLDWHDDPKNWDVIYRADPNQPAGGWRDTEGNVIQPPWRPSIHMPRWASRITLEITGVRVERLQDISADDARAEGCPDRPVPGAEQASIDLLTKLWFHDLWAEINGQASWDANPWVWVIEFKRVEGGAA